MIKLLQLDGVSIILIPDPCCCRLSYLLATATRVVPIGAMLTALILSLVDFLFVAHCHDRRGGRHRFITFNKGSCCLVPIRATSLRLLGNLR